MDVVARRLNDALFKAGLRSGSQFEWTDEPNRLHFDVVDVHHDAAGILLYTVAVRSLDGAGPHERGVEARAPESLGVSGPIGVLEVNVTNTGERAATDPALHPADPSAFAAGDVYRLSVEVDGEGWTAHLRNALAALVPGRSAAVPVHVARAAGAKPGRVVITAVSGSDLSKRAATATTVR